MTAATKQRSTEPVNYKPELTKGWVIRGTFTNEHNGKTSTSVSYWDGPRGWGGSAWAPLGYSTPVYPTKRAATEAFRETGQRLSKRKAIVKVDQATRDEINDLCRRSIEYETLERPDASGIRRWAVRARIAYLRGERIYEVATTRYAHTEHAAPGPDDWRAAACGVKAQNLYRQHREFDPNDPRSCKKCKTAIRQAKRRTR